MVHSMVLVERDVLQHELETVFDSRTTETLLYVLDRVASQVYAAMVPRSDFSRLERLVEQIALEQAQLSKFVQKLAEQVQQLLEAQRRNEERFSRIESDIAELKTDVAILKTDVAELKTDVAELKTDVAILKTDVAGLKTDVGHLKGDSLERKYRDKAPAYFGRLIRKPKVVDLNRLWDALEQHLSEEELNDVLLIDLLVKGKPKARTLSDDLYLAVEVSAVIDRNDVERAQRRASLLRKADFHVVPVAAGEELTTGAKQEAQTQKVAIVRNGGVSLWEEALSAWM